MKKFIIEMEDGGLMKGELYPEIAPETVKNFEENTFKNCFSLREIKYNWNINAERNAFENCYNGCWKSC